MPEIRQNFTVHRPVPVVWAFFQDVPKVAQCMPGVELVDDHGDDSYSGQLKLKLGPINATFQGDAHITERDSGAHRGSISAKGVDRQGGSRATADVSYWLAAVDDGTAVSIEATISLQGSMAQFGRTGLLEEVSGRLTKEFAECLSGKLTAPTEEEAATVRARDVRGLSLLIQSLWGWLRRALSGKRAR